MPPLRDPILEYYYKLTKSNYLHYGYWDTDDALTIGNLRLAQEKYIDHLILLIPPHVKTILDVGCGVGGNALRLEQAGFIVEALSPDLYQQQVFRASEVEFHLSKFEDFETDRKYDLILMSESVQYIAIESGFAKCRHLLNDQGILLVSDYFTKRKLAKDNVFAIRTHDLSEYLQAANKYRFKPIQSEDITTRITPTLGLIRQIYDDYLKPTIELVDCTVRDRVPILYKPLRFLVSPLVKHLSNQLQLIDSQLFREHRQYMIYLLQKQ